MPGRVPTGHPHRETAPPFPAEGSAAAVRFTLGMVPVCEGAQARRFLVKVVSVIGTRPQYVKAAVVTRALREHGDFDEITVDTGQHYDEEMSELLLRDLPDVQRSRNLDVHGDLEGEVLARTIDAVGEVLVEEQ